MTAKNSEAKVDTNKAMLLVKNKSTYHAVYCFYNHHNNHKGGLGDILHQHYNTLDSIYQLIQVGNIHTLYADSIRLFTIGHKNHHPDTTYKDIGIALDEGVKANAHHIYIYANDLWRHTPLAI
ncbi:hypothetical protein [Agarilytica rhodophyticola]|uniref:hypothetical protein n=1 Tax=Agarilytica rhodophyticola TaxID=1737490 RepID=UPI000B348B5A|nr:hypothetical protein [Agarilytica rhodophyticola]